MCWEYNKYSLIFICKGEITFIVYALCVLEKGETTSNKPPAGQHHHHPAALSTRNAKTRVPVAHQEC